MKAFEDLAAWPGARQGVNGVYALTRTAGLVKDWGLGGQIQRAAVSFMSNLAEGFERLHRPEKLPFYHVARGSCGEVRSLLYVIEDNYPALAEPTAHLREAVARVGRPITGLVHSTQRKSGE